MHKCLNIISTRSSGGVKEGGMGKSFGEQSGKTRLMSSGAGRLFCRGLGFRLRGSCSVCCKCSVVSVRCSERVAMSSVAMNGRGCVLRQLRFHTQVWAHSAWECRHAA